MFEKKNFLNMEKKSVFLVNFFLIAYIIFTLLFRWSIETFFYVNIIVTLIVSYFFFKRSRKLAKVLIVTNLFIFFYFLSPQVSLFFYELFGVKSYLFVLLYSIFLAYIFLVFSGYHREFLGNLKKTNLKIVLSILLVGLALGFFFFFIKEPIPTFFVQSYDGQIWGILLSLAFSSFVIALAEQMIFSGFLFNSYKSLTTTSDAYFQTAIVFFLFHILRFEIIVVYYHTYFAGNFLVYITAYYLMLFFFMLFALYLYSFKSKKYEGNFVYPVALHFATDFGLFLFYTLAAIS